MMVTSHIWEPTAWGRVRGYPVYRLEGILRRVQICVNLRVRVSARNFRTSTHFHTASSDVPQTRSGLQQCYRGKGFTTANSAYSGLANAM